MTSTRSPIRHFMAFVPVQRWATGIAAIGTGNVCVVYTHGTFSLPDCL